MKSPENFPSEANELQARRMKLEQRSRLGLRAYPNDFRKKEDLGSLQAMAKGWSAEELKVQDLRVQVAGRCLALRRLGKLMFGRLRDSSGLIQLVWSEGHCGAENFELCKRTLDVGDILGVVGKLFRTQTGELSVAVESCTLLTKALRPMPNKFHGLADQEICQRQRYLDLVGNEATFHRFQIRARLMQALRSHLFQEGFLEFETPMMQPIPGGATARPFVTRHHALQRDFYLRVSPELYLKRLLVGGFEKVFELNRSFRNEGLSTRHNPEFTMLEFYEAFVDYRTHMVRIERLFQEVYRALQKFWPDFKAPCDLSQPFIRASFDALLARHWGDAVEAPLGLKDWRDRCQKLQLPYQLEEGEDDLKLRLFEHCIEPTLIQPTFVTDYPTQVSPLARPSDRNPERAERFELFVQGMELANGFSELNNPDTQAENFHRQVQARDLGNEEAMFFDGDYIEALKVGLPPAAGTGIGIDRWVMWWTQSQSIREVVLFPAMREKKGEREEA